MIGCLDLDWICSKIVCVFTECVKVKQIVPTSIVIKLERNLNVYNYSLPRKYLLSLLFKKKNFYRQLTGKTWLGYFISHFEISSRPPPPPPPTHTHIPPPHTHTHTHTHTYHHHHLDKQSATASIPIIQLRSERKETGTETEHWRWARQSGKRW